MIEKKKNPPNNAPGNKSKKDGNEEVTVLYQRLGTQWYAFSSIEGNVFYGKIKPEDEETSLELMEGEHPDAISPGRVRVKES